MGELRSLNQEDIGEFSSVLNLSVDTGALTRAAERLWYGEVPGGDTIRELSIVRRGLEEALNLLTPCEELTSCFVDAMAVLRRVTSGSLVWRVFCSSDQGKCKRPLSDYNKAFRGIRSYFKGIWDWNLERGGYSLPDSVRILLLYELFHRDAGALRSAHLAAAGVYRELVEQRAEYLIPDFAQLTVEYAFHTSSAVKVSHGLFPLQKTPGTQSGTVENEIKRQLGELRNGKNLTKFLKDAGRARALLEKCVSRISLDDVLSVMGPDSPESACSYILASKWGGV